MVLFLMGVCIIGWKNKVGLCWGAVLCYEKTKKRTLSDSFARNST